MAFKIKTISGVDYLSGLIVLHLAINNLTDEVINDLALPNSLVSLDLSYNQIVTFNPTIPLPSSLVSLNLYNNQIVIFNPTISLPNSLVSLNLSYNQIVSFNPSVPLPNSLEVLFININQMTTAGYTASEPWANAMSIIPSRGNILSTSNVDSMLGTNLETILTAKGWTVFP
tara:strand:+ start:51 stop:566 length:516 start_codon:yes stop_codon:yes gene_type:complete